MKAFYNVVNSIICCAKLRSAFFDRPEYWMSAICLAKLWKTESLHYIRGLYDKKQRLIVLFTAEVMYKKYKRLAYTPPDLLERFCKVNLSNAKNSASFCFPRICFRGLIYWDQEPLRLMWSKMIAILLIYYKRPQNIENSSRLYL